MKNIDQSTKPLVSVIIPALNAAKYIRQALDSVLSQTYKRIEAIVVDDGSSDATSTIIEEFVKRDSRVQLVWQSNAGVGAARNTAIGKARGKYIASLDADDFWFPEKLEKQVACMEQYGIETGLVYCWSTLIDEHGDFLSNGLPQTVEGRLRHALILRNVVGCASVPLFRASALEQVGLYLTRAEQAGAQGCEDWDLSLRIAEIFSIRVVPESLVAYRQTRSSMSVRTEEMAASFAVTMGRARQRNSDLPAATFRWSAGNFYVYLVGRCMRWGHYARCFRFLKEAVRADPVLLLSTNVYRALLKSLLKLIMRPSGNRPAEPVRPRPKKTGEQAGLNSEKGRRFPFISNRLFEQIELERWSGALKDGG
ncbi:MAG: glycosyltransferase family 2 protein [Verrucomicrobia bacterium]|nr:glycosyltransferase family 2 protein [Verrucomicrobiota bacterium]